jgi:arylsulfatase A-like enzyme
MGGSPGLSFAAALSGGQIVEAHDAVFFEAETARSIRTKDHLYTNHLDGTGVPELYDLIADPEQWTNVAADPERAAEVARLHDRLTAFFAEHVDDRYDLWNGGTGQAMVSRYLLFKQRYGRDWNVTMDVGPTYDA